jgi:hypothetical protein
VSVAAGARPSEAGVANVPCRTPFVFRDAAVNVVVLPYESAVETGSPAGLGTRLAGLLQLEALRSIAKLGSVGAVQMVGSDCDADLVVDRLLGKQPGAQATVRPGNGLVVVWGRLYSREGDLFLQTFCRFLRSGVDETLDLVAGGRPFSGQLSAQAFACAPRKVTTEDLRSFEQQFYRSMVVRSTPDENAFGTPMPTAPLPYWISEVRQDWMRIDSQGGGLSGWVRLSGARDPWSLARWMPELAYVEGMAGYLRYRIATRQSVRAPASWIEAVTAALTEYERSLEPPPGTPAAPGPRPPGWRTAVASAVQLQLRGMLFATKAEATAADRAAALDLFERARVLVPHDANARNLVAMMRLSRAPDGADPGASAKETAAELLQALGSDPANPRLLANLESAYEALVSQPGASASLSDRERQEVAERLTAIRQIRSRR